MVKAEAASLSSSRATKVGYLHSLHLPIRANREFEKYYRRENLDCVFVISLLNPSLHFIGVYKQRIEKLLIMVGLAFLRHAFISCLLFVVAQPFITG